MKLKPIAQIRPETGVGLVTLGHKVKEVIARVNLLTEEKEAAMASYNVPHLSPLERIDELLEVVDKEAHEIIENVGRVNEKLLPSIPEKDPDKQLIEEMAKKPEPDGWLERKIRHLDHLKDLLRQVSGETRRLKNTVLSKVPITEDQIKRKGGGH